MSATGVIVDLGGCRGGWTSTAERLAHTSANVRSASSTRRPRRHGLRLPPDPSSGRWATLGGMLSTNAAGARSVRYGSVRSWVDAAHPGHRGRRAAQTASGRSAGSQALPRFAVLPKRAAAPHSRRLRPLIATRFPHTRKNSSGYALDAYLSSGDLLDLVIGAEGTLGFVTEMAWRLDPIPPHRAALRVALRSLDQLSDVCHCALRPLEPSAIELLDRSSLSWSHQTP